MLKSRTCQRLVKNKYPSGSRYRISIHASGTPSKSSSWSRGRPESRRAIARPQDESARRAMSNLVRLGLAMIISDCRLQIICQSNLQSAICNLQLLLDLIPELDPRVVVRGRAPEFDAIEVGWVIDVQLLGLIRAKQVGGLQVRRAVSCHADDHLLHLG